MKIQHFIPLVLLWACAAPDPRSELFNRGEALYVESEADEKALEARVISAIDRAKERVWASFERLESVAIARALVRAEARGVDVRVVSDVDRKADPGLLVLIAELGELEDGKGRLQLFGDALGHSPQPTRMLERGSELNQITHTFLLIDDNRVLNLSQGFGAAPFARWGFDVRSTDIAKDFEDEHTQVFGGVSATTLSYFDGMLKSNTNNRIYYPMPEDVWELYFGPQERLMKRIVDEIYAARASVQIITPELSNTFVVDALRYKARIGGIVDVMVDEASVERPTSRFDDLQQALVDDASSAELRLGGGLGFTAVVIDAERARDGRRYQTRVLVLSHALVESIPFDASDVSRLSDAFMDGNMWVWSRPSQDESPSVDRALARFERRFAAGSKP
jgi:phosphatidylserine/phosphatidylglycerophosphate/cardiolipin synthase-like enzyme